MATEGWSTHLGTPYQLVNKSANNSGREYYEVTGETDGAVSELQRAVTLSVMCGVSAVTNILALYMLTCGYRRNHKRLSIFWAPLINLCVADFIITTFGMGGSAAWHFTNQWRAGDFMCRFVKYVQVLGNNASTYIIMFISIDRAVAVSRPMTSLSSARFRIRCFLFTAWLLAALCSLPQWFIFALVEAPPPFEPGFYQCYGVLSAEMSLLYSLIVCVVSFLIPFVVMIVAYTVIVVVIRRKSKEHPSDLYEDEAENERALKKSKAKTSGVKAAATKLLYRQKCDTKNHENSSPKLTSLATKNPPTTLCHQLIVPKANGTRGLSQQSAESNFSIASEAGKMSGAAGGGTGTGTGTAAGACRSAKNNRVMWFKRAKQKSLKTFLIIITSFLICWIPYYSFFLAFTIRNYARYLSSNQDSASQPESTAASGLQSDADEGSGEIEDEGNNAIEEAVANWTGLFAMLSPMVNPLIYGSFQFKFFARLWNYVTSAHRGLPDVSSVTRTSRPFSSYEPTNDPE